MLHKFDEFINNNKKYLKMNFENITLHNIFN